MFDSDKQELKRLHALTDTIVRAYQEVADTARSELWQREQIITLRAEITDLKVEIEDLKNAEAELYPGPDAVGAKPLWMSNVTPIEERGDV